MKRLRRHAAVGVVAGFVAFAGGAVPPSPAAVSLPPFTTTPTSSAGVGTSIALLQRVRVARHPGYDRIVFAFQQGTSGYSVRYVARVVHDGSGLPVALAGHAFLHVVFQHAHIQRAAGGPAIALTPGFPTLVQVKEAGDFEAVVSFGLGLRHRVGFRVFRLGGPNRVVIDVAR